MTRPCSYPRLAVLSAALLAGSLALQSCSQRLPDTIKLPSVPEERELQTSRFVDNEPAAIRRISVPGAFKPARIDRPVGGALGDIPVNLSLPAGSTMGDLVFALGTMDVKIAYNEEGAEAVTVEKRRLPFMNYKGNVAGLFEMLETASGIVASEKDGVVYLGETARYSVSLPQNSDILDTISAEVERLGAKDVTKSVHGGQLLYSAQPRVNRQAVDPFLRRVARNLAVVNMQVAIVSLAINDTSAQGFDWEAFRIRLDSIGDTGASGSDQDAQTPAATPNQNPGSGSGSGNGNGGIGSPGNGNIGGVPGLGDLNKVGTIVDLTSAGLSLGHTASGQIFGRAGLMSFAGAIKFLSTFGETKVTQNVDMRTVSGQQVTLRSGQQVPYVKNINSNSTDSGNISGGTETATVETGLTVELQPWFDATTNLVTLDLDVTIRQILQFVELSAGNTVGSISQPLTQDQSLNDLIRMRAGETIVVGGLQNDNESFTGNEPTFLRGRSKSFGARSQNVTRNAFFVIVRPTITIFDQENDS